ncbi:Kae1-associated serine/threonine protein kinase [Candidatus Nanohaloarchaea archaeon]|nr:Kae1-associated serine/threonine protein kinase [Candidatus Nanohaloarchaea archaeon]
MSFRGAEAVIEITDDRVVKTREPKKYRHPELDSKIRTERTKTEARIMKKAKKHGVNVPEILDQEDSVIKMQRIEGLQLKEVLEEDVEKMKSLGENVALLHDTDIVHGDLTTSNAVSNDYIYIIDFGLAFHSDRVEDKAVDIHLLKQVLNSSHPEVAEEAWEKFVEGYRKYSEADKVLEQLKEVERRGRYK